jgi:hypothetical protein
MQEKQEFLLAKMQKANVPARGPKADRVVPG